MWIISLVLPSLNSPSPYPAYLVWTVMRSRMRVMSSNSLLCVDLQAGKVMSVEMMKMHAHAQPVSDAVWQWTGSVILFGSQKCWWRKWVTGEVLSSCQDEASHFFLLMLFSLLLHKMRQIWWQYVRSVKIHSKVRFRSNGSVLVWYSIKLYLRLGFFSFILNR